MLQILDKWELQENKRKNGDGVMCTGGVVMFRHPPLITFLWHLWSPILPQPVQLNLKKNRTTSQIPLSQPEKIQHKTPETQ